MEYCSNKVCVIEWSITLDEGGSEFNNILFSSAVTASGLILILLIQYLSLFLTCK